MEVVWHKERDLFLRLINEEDTRRRRSEVLKRGGNRKMTNETRRARANAEANISPGTQAPLSIHDSVALSSCLTMALRSIIITPIVNTKIYKNSLSSS